MSGSYRYRAWNLAHQYLGHVRVGGDPLRHAQFVAEGYRARTRRPYAGGDSVPVRVVRLLDVHYLLPSESIQDGSSERTSPGTDRGCTTQPVSRRTPACSTARRCRG